MRIILILALLTFLGDANSQPFGNSTTMAVGNGDPHEADLKFKRENKLWKFYGVEHIGQENNPPPTKDNRNPSSDTLYWYRAMEPDKYEEMLQNNQFPVKPAYGGIASNHKYVVRKYFTNKSKANRIVEFDTTKIGKLVDYFTSNGVNEPKPEDDAISYGLGDRGTRPYGRPRQLFNDLLNSGDITWRVVDKKVPL